MLKLQSMAGIELWKPTSHFPGYHIPFNGVSKSIFIFIFDKLLALLFIDSNSVIYKMY